MYGMSQGNVSRGSVARQSGRLPWQVPGTLSLFRHAERPGVSALWEPLVMTVTPGPLMIRRRHGGHRGVSGPQAGGLVQRTG